MPSSIKILAANETLAVLDRTQVTNALRAAFLGLEDGSTVQPPQTVTVLPDNKGDAIFYPGAIANLDLIGVKVSPYLTTLAKEGKSPVSAWTLLLSASTGKPVLLCDSLALTTARTAATTALALEYLTPPDAKTLAIIGTGKLALEHLAYVAPQQDWKSISVWSPTINSDVERAALTLENARKISDVATLAPSAEMAVRGADVVMLCTSSGTPVIDHSWLSPNAVVTSISTNEARAHEIEPATLQSYAVYCDYRKTALSTAGEMIIATERGCWKSDSLCGDLVDLITGKAERPDNGRVFFRSTGLGLEDLAIASLLI